MKAELFALYRWTFAAGGFAAMALGLLGCQLAARDRAMQTLCVGQGAMIGVLLALGLVPVSHHTPFVPFLFALALSGAIFLATDHLARASIASRNTLFAYGFAILLATSHLIGAVLPALESHMAQVYFGDLATLSNLESVAAILGALVCLWALQRLSQPFSEQSFECALFGEEYAIGRFPRLMAGFRFLTLIMLCISVQFLGFLFTIAFLFIPTGILARMRSQGLNRHLFLCAIVSLASALCGTALSLTYTILPTVPTAVFCLVLFSAIVLAADRLKGVNRQKGLSR